MPRLQHLGDPPGLDDEPVARKILQEFTEQVPFLDLLGKFESAMKAEEFLKSNQPDLIFLDIDMPLMDGFQFLDEFEKLSNVAKKKCKIVMLTSSINPQDFNRSKKYENVKLYLNKPLSHESISKLEV